MTAIVCLRDKDVLEQFFRRNVGLHIYSIGDLDDFFWPHTEWYGLVSDGETLAITLLYSGGELPVLLALSDEPEAMETLLGTIANQLPDNFYAHFSPGLESVFAESHTIGSQGAYRKMLLNSSDMAMAIDCSSAELLTQANLLEIKAFYAEAYPGSWFDERMLETEQYFGVRENGRLVSVAGIHVYSGVYRVAALGNVATRPERRGEGFGRIAAAAVCQNLLGTVDHIGLNVKADNAAAIAAYSAIGFNVVAPYGEFMVEKK